MALVEGKLRAFGVGCAALVLPALLADARAKDVVLSWQETVQIEHQDRTARLRRLSDTVLAGSPRFYEERIARSELPAGFGIDIPVLRVVFPQRVFFDTDQSDLRPEAQAVIDVVAEALRREASDTAVFIAGHTDDRGDDAYNYDLSVRRADSVARALAARGVRQASVWRVGFGEAVPIVPNTSDAAMARNRRVEFLFGRKPEAVGTWLSKQEAVVCAGAPGPQRDDCLRAFARLSRVEATPVTTASIQRAPANIPLPDTTIVVPPIEPRVAVPTRPEPATVVPHPATAPARAQLPPEEKTVVTITRDDPVVIDLREKRVFVGRLER